MGGAETGEKLFGSAPLVALLLLCDAHAGGSCELGYQTRLAGAAVHAGEPVAFRAHGAGTGPPNATAYHFQFSSAMTTTDAAVVAGEVTSLAGRVTRAFEQGVHIATVYCRPAPEATSNGSGAAPPIMFWPLARVRLDVVATGVRFCYEYQVEQLPAGVLVASVWDKSEPTVERATFLTAQFLTVHAAPSVQLSSMTKSGSVAVLPVSGMVNATGVRDGWQIVVPEVYKGPMDSALDLHLSPPVGLSLLGCSIAPSTVHISRTPRSLPRDSPYAELNVQISPGGVKFRDHGEYPPISRVTSHPNPCRPSELTVLSEGLYNKFGLLLSNDFTGVPQLDGAARSFTRISDTAAWICAELAASGTTTCPITYVHGVLPLVSGYTTELLVNTPEGVAHFIGAGPTTPSAALTNLSTVVPGVHGRGLRMLATTYSPCAEPRSFSPTNFCFFRSGWDRREQLQLQERQWHPKAQTV